MVTDVRGLIPFGLREHLLDFVPRRTDRKRSLSEHTGCFERRRQARAATAAHLRIAKEGPQLTDDLLDGGRSIATSSHVRGERLVQLRHCDSAERLACGRAEP